MPVSGSMTVKVVMLCSNPRRGIAAYIALMAPLPVRRYRRVIAAARLGERFSKPQNKGTVLLLLCVQGLPVILHGKHVIFLTTAFC